MYLHHQAPLRVSTTGVKQHWKIATDLKARLKLYDELQCYSLTLKKPLSFYISTFQFVSLQVLRFLDLLTFPLLLRLLEQFLVALVERRRLVLSHYSGFFLIIHNSCRSEGHFLPLINVYNILEQF